MTNNEIEILNYITKIIKAAQDNDVKAAEMIVKEINEKEYSEDNLGEIGDIIFDDAHNQCNEVHLYCLENINNLPDKEASIRIARALMAFGFSKEDKRKYLDSVVNKDYAMSGHKTDFYFCSILIRLCLSIQAFDLISMIQEILNKNKGSEGV